MFVSKIAEQLKEYNRLQGLTDNIRGVIDILEQEKESAEKPDGYATGGFSNATITLGDFGTNTNAMLNSDVVDIMRSDLITLFVDHVEKLETEKAYLKV